MLASADRPIEQKNQMVMNEQQQHPLPKKISQKIQGKEKECEKKQNKLVIHVSFGEIAISLIFSIMMLSASNVKFSAFKIGFVQRTWEATEVLRILEISVVPKHVVKERY